MGKPAYKVHDNTFVYIEGNASDEAVTIAIPAVQRQIALKLVTRGDRGVNYIREFLRRRSFLGQRASNSKRSWMPIQVLARQFLADSMWRSVPMDNYRAKFG